MSEKVIENNKVSVIGEIISGFTFSHGVFLCQAAGDAVCV